MRHALEWIEQRALEDVSRAMAGRAGELGQACRDLAGAHLSAYGALPPSAIVVNRTIGLGLHRAADAAILDELVATYAAAGVRRYFVHLHPEAQPADLDAMLGARGLVAARAWVKFERGREAPPDVATTLDLRLAGPADAATLGTIAADAFDLGPQGQGIVAALIGRPNWHVFMTSHAGAVAGCGALYVEDGIGWLDWGATAPAFRGRNGQSALLRRRIEAALDLGCRTIATCTGEEVPGDPQISWHNIIKMGFTRAYTRRNFAPPREP
ncbi:MAG: hypothetical protein R3D25_04370 [Geminicoccaceae bacterium]